MEIKVSSPLRWCSNRDKSHLFSSPLSWYSVWERDRWNYEDKNLKFISSLTCCFVACLLVGELTRFIDMRNCKNPEKRSAQLQVLMVVNYPHSHWRSAFLLIRHSKYSATLLQTAFSAILPTGKGVFKCNK